MKKNYRRENPPPYPPAAEISRSQGFLPASPWGYIEKSAGRWPRVSLLAGKSIGHSHIGYKFTNGHRGMAKAVRGAKKFVRSRIRFHENAATRRLLTSNEGEDSR